LIEQQRTAKYLRSKSGNPIGKTLIFWTQNTKSDQYLWRDLMRKLYAMSGERAMR
jgi:hypothetical protein